MTTIHPDAEVFEDFAGPGGWDEGLRLLGLDGITVGVEWDEAACETARAAGHIRIHADVLDVKARTVAPNYVGYIGSPPCQSYSTAGKGLGKLDLPRILAHVTKVRAVGRWLDPGWLDGWHDPRSPLVLVPLWRILTDEPEWVALEQVPAVLPLWEAYADVMRDHGWSVSTGVLSAEQYGVAQTRKRAILVGDRHYDATLPAPIMRLYRKGVGQDEGDPRLAPWVSMAEVLHADDFIIRSNYGTGGDPAARGERTAAEGSAAVTSKVGRNAVLRTSKRKNAAVRDLGEPSSTITSGHSTNDRVWVLEGNQRPGGSTVRHRRSSTEPAGSVTSGTRSARWITGMARNAGPGAVRDPRSLDAPAYTMRANGSGSHPSGTEWVDIDKPATAIQGDPRVAKRGHHDRQMDGALRVSINEASVLQSFPLDYPWNGGARDASGPKYRQVGDAVPPLLAAAVIGELVGRPWREICATAYRRERVAV